MGQRELTMGALIAASMLAGRALAPAGQVVGLMMQYQAARTALDSLDKIMDKPVERPSAESGAPGFIQRREFKGDIEFRNVRFAYPGRDDVALDGVSFKIHAGEKVALIGRVGSGKSTIQRLILGLYQPTHGSVLLDAPLLMLDEPTSAMDFSTEAHITARIGAYAHHKTVLLVTHRTSLLQLVGRAIVVDGGKIVADGPRDTIMAALQSGRVAKAA